jgi:hypothetical protein
MQRAAIEKPRTVRTWRRHLAAHAAPVVCECEFQVGRFRKGRRVGGCSTSACFLCHFDKLARVPTLQQMRFLAVFREGLAEVA